MSEKLRAGAWPMNLAPRDGTTLRLLVCYGKDEKPGYWTPLEDDFESWTIGHNNFDNDGENRWRFVGWDWAQDYYLEAAAGEVIGWLPFLPSEDEGEPGDGGRYGIPVEKGQPTVTTCRVWFTDLKEAQEFSRYSGDEIWDLQTGTRVV